MNSYNLINLRYSIPTNTFFFNSINGSLGKLVSDVAPSVVYSEIAPNVYSNIVIQFYDQMFNKLNMNDNKILLTLAIDYSREV